jgi:hypothetical protein
VMVISNGIMYSLREANGATSLQLLMVLNLAVLFPFITHKKVDVDVDAANVVKEWLIHKVVAVCADNVVKLAAERVVSSVPFSRTLLSLSVFSLLKMLMVSEPASTESTK